MRTGLLLIWLVLQGLTVAQSDVDLQVKVDLAPTYLQGQEASVNFAIALEGSEEVLEQTVLFLNIVERDPAGRRPQAAHKIFASAKETPRIFRQVYTGAQLREGVYATLEFQLRSGAKLGDYALVVQVFEGDETNPSRVRIENRLGIKSFPFSIGAN